LALSSQTRPSVRREVEKTAKTAQQYVETRLFASSRDYLQSNATKPGVEQILVELDGCHIRTGKKVVSENAKVIQIRQIPSTNRPCEWREVRVGLARPLLEQDQRTYVARMGEYSGIGKQLLEAAIEQGMSKQTQVIAVADSGHGLKETLVAWFPKLIFILDRPHLKQHLYAGAEAMELTDCKRHNWVGDKLSLIDKGLVKLVIWQLERYQGTGQKRIVDLSEYLKCFSHAVHYEKFLGQGFPVGSGEVESAHRYIPQKRLKTPGATWHPDTINPMLALRIIRANDWWEDFWRQQSARARVS
jgi:hypothetical protein